MSCIDAAIIKALVEHIGMNPDDVQLGGARTVFPSSAYAKRDNTGMNMNGEYLRITQPSSQTQLQVGDFIEITRTDNSVDHYLIIKSRSFMANITLTAINLETGVVCSIGVANNSSTNSYEYTLYAETILPQAVNAYARKAELTGNDALVVLLLRAINEVISLVANRVSALESKVA